jgi:AbrB family looped-hinge helix DNA binding protein
MNLGKKILHDVTTRISSKGQIVIPRQVRERQKIQPGDDFVLLELSNGDILLRHIQRPKKSLVWHLRRLQGLKLNRNREPVREINW